MAAITQNGARKASAEKMPPLYVGADWNFSSL